MTLAQPPDPALSVTCGGCGWSGTVGKVSMVGAAGVADCRPDDLVRCPRCRTPVARVVVTLSREDLDRIPLPAVRDAVADAMSRRLHEEVGRRMLGPDPDVVIGGEG